MIGVDLGQEIIIPSSVAVIGALIAGLSAVVKAWFENRDARRKAERQLQLAKNRTEFVKQWIAVSKELGDDTNAVNKAIEELNEAYGEAQVAFSRRKSRSVLGQLRRLLMLVRRQNPASYVVSGVFLFVSTCVWLFLCIPVPGDDSFGYPAAILSAFFTTIVLRIVAEMIVRVFERFSGSSALTITKVALRSNVATITTSENHALQVGQTVVVDASNDIFDGTYTVAELPEMTDGDGDTPDTLKSGSPTFNYFLNAADVSSSASTGLVYRDTVKDQMSSLLMLGRNRSRRAHVVTALFLVCLLGFASWSVSRATKELKADDYPLCYTDEYFGSYFGFGGYVGDYDPVVLSLAPPYEGETVDVDAVDSIKTFLEDGPLWGRPPADFKIIEVRRSSNNNGEDWVLVADNGDMYILDVDGLKYVESRAFLYKRGLDKSLAEIGDPCDPQTVKLLTQTIPFGDDPPDNVLFAYDVLPDYEDTIYLTEPSGQAQGGSDRQESPENALADVRGYFGRDGRFIPVCSAGSEQIQPQPCILQEDVVYDSGLYATVSLLLKTGMQIIAFAIASRVFFGLIAWGFEKYSRWREVRNARAGPQTAPAVAG